MDHPNLTELMNELTALFEPILRRQQRASLVAAALQGLIASGDYRSLAGGYLAASSESSDASSRLAEWAVALAHITMAEMDKGRE